MGQPSSVPAQVCLEPRDDFIAKVDWPAAFQTDRRNAGTASALRGQSSLREPKYARNFLGMQALALDVTKGIDLVTNGGHGCTTAGTGRFITS